MRPTSVLTEQGLRLEFEVVDETPLKQKPVPKVVVGSVIKDYAPPDAPSV